MPAAKRIPIPGTESEEVPNSVIQAAGATTRAQMAAMPATQEAHSAVRSERRDGGSGLGRLRPAGLTRSWAMTTFPVSPSESEAVASGATAYSK